MTYFYLAMFLLGASLGSFLACQVCRLRLRATNQPSPGPRSVCLHCKTKLKPYDNIPLLSWLLLKGRCRTCHHKIGLAEPLAELVTALAFTSSAFRFYPPTATSFPLAVLPLFLAELALALALIFLALYDAKHQELPVSLLTFSVICAIIISYLKQPALLDLFGAILVLSGTYYLLYRLSKGRWVGDGDYLLALALALALAHFGLALFTLFLANFFGCLFALPQKPQKHTKIPLGPFLVLAFLLVLHFSTFLGQLIGI